MWLCLYVCFVFGDRVSLWNPGHPGTCYEDPADLELRDLPVPAIIKSMCQHTQLACIYVKCTVHRPGALRVLKTAMDPQELELWKTMGGGNQTEVLDKSQQVLLTAELFLQSLILPYKANVLKSVYSKLGKINKLKTIT